MLFIKITYTNLRCMRYVVLYARFALCKRMFFESFDLSQTPALNTCTLLSGDIGLQVSTESNVRRQ